MTTDKTPATLAVDVLAVMDAAQCALEIDARRELAEEINEARAAVAELIAEGRKMETFIHQVGMHCKPFSAALARVKGESA